MRTTDLDKKDKYEDRLIFKQHPKIIKVCLWLILFKFNIVIVIDQIKLAVIQNILDVPMYR